MIMLHKAAQMALEALENVLNDDYNIPYSKIVEAITALRAALAEPEPTCNGMPAIEGPLSRSQRKAALAEPQVWVCPEAADTRRYTKPGHCEDCGKTLVQMAEPVQEPIRWDASAPLVVHPHPAFQTTPPQRKPLTEEEIINIGKATRAVEGSHILPVTFARAIERAHKIGGRHE